MRTSLLPLLWLTACGPGKITLGASDSGVLDSGVAPSADADGDGYAAQDLGGDDCDDADASVHPGATETWYDGVDQDCDGASDNDADLDGADSAAHGGADCDDADPAVFPGAGEERDGVDQDCDGLVDEDFVAAGDVVVSEIMHHPLAASDNDGEWFELTNTTDNAIDLRGWVISSDDGDAITIAGSLVLVPGSPIVLGASADTALNGGVTVTYVYDRATMSLSADDSLFLTVDNGTIFDVSWTSSWGDAEGASLSLDPDHLAAADARRSDYWCEADSELPSGDFGTPGARNDDCTSIDEDGDGRSVDQGDCDDTDATVHPGADDVWNGVDDDCSNTVDDADVTDVALGSVDGSTGSFTPVPAGLGLGDVTADATVDIVVGASMGGSYAGVTWVIDGDDVQSLHGAASDWDEATITGDNYTYTGSTSAIAGDVTGDGRADLVVAGGVYGGTGNADSVLVFEGGHGVTGALDSGDATLAIQGTAGAYGAINRVLTSADTNGDGVDEIVYGEPYASSEARYYCGRVLVYDPTGLGGEVSADDADSTISGGPSQAYLGTGLGAGDLDGDGYDDLLLGASGVDDGATDGGAWYVLEGGDFDGDVGIATAAEQTILGDTASAQIGFGNAAVGEFFGGGVDLAVGGLQADQVYVFSHVSRLGSELETSDADLVIDGDGAGAFGFALAAGDVDGDGTDDLLAGAPGVTTTYGGPAYWYNSPGSGKGMLYLFSGADLGMGGLDASDAGATAEGETTGDLFGAVLSGVADIDGDGAGDVLAGAPRGGTSGSGRVYVVPGRD